MRKRLIFFVLSLVGAAAAPAQTPTQLSIASGESVVLQIGADGGVTISSWGVPPPMEAVDSRALRDLLQIPVPPRAKTIPPVAVNGDGTTVTPVKKGEVHLSFRDAPGKTPQDALLIISNGYEMALRYKAVMRRGNKSAPTDVCLVMPMRRGYEHWPFQLDRLDLSEIQLVPWKPGDSVSCA